MKIAAHITFYYVERRLPYLKQVVEGLLAMPHATTVYVYSNKDLREYRHSENVKVLVYGYADNGIKWRHSDIWHRSRLYRYLVRPRKLLHRLRLTKLTNPYYLTWEHRTHVRANLDEFDVQLYLEDDMAFTSSSLDYWMKYKDLCLRHGYNLGFLRTEVTPAEETYITDLTVLPKQVVELEGRKFLLNDLNPYYGFWIYDRRELKKFAKSREWNFKFRGYDLRAQAAIGWHGIGMTRYKGTLIPLLQKGGSEYETDPACAVRHLPNNYLGHAKYCKSRFPLTVREPRD